MLSQIQLLYQVSPIFLTRGIASTISGGMLPLLSLLNTNAFSPNLLAGDETFELDDAFAIFQPAANGTLVEQLIAQYPFANLSVAANAIIRNPINVSMIMMTPQKSQSSWSLKSSMMESLKATLDQHNNLGGTYTVFTPAHMYEDMLMLSLTDVSIAQSPLPQNAWRWDFTRPLVTLQDVIGAMNNLMSMITSGASPPGQGAPSTTGTPTALTADPSVVNQGQGTAPTISSNPLVSNFGTPISGGSSLPWDTNPVPFPNSPFG